MSLKRYILHIIIELADKLLAKTDMTESEIA